MRHSRFATSGQDGDFGAASIEAFTLVLKTRLRPSPLLSLSHNTSTSHVVPNACQRHDTRPSSERDIRAVDPTDTVLFARVFLPDVIAETAGNPGVVVNRTGTYSHGMATSHRMVGIVRVSTEDQAESGLGLGAQERAIREECARRGWVLVDVIAEPATSARQRARPGLRAALEMVGADLVDGILVSRLDRLCRSVVDLGNVLAWLDHAGGHLVALDLGVDTSTPAGRMVANVMVSVSEWETDVISVRTADALAEKRQRGEVVGRAAVPPEIAERIRQLREVDGLSYRAICATLDAEGVPTARGAAAWNVGAIQGALGYQRPKRRRTADLPPLPRRERQPAGRRVVA